MGSATVGSARFFPTLAAIALLWVPGTRVDAWTDSPVEAIDCAGVSIDRALCGAFDQPTGDQEPLRAEALQKLLSETTSADWTIRWHAVDRLGTLREPAALPALVRVALHDDNSHPRWRALWAIRSIDASASGAVAAFRRALDDSAPSVIGNAAVALAYFGHDDGRSTLMRRLEDPDAFRRREAAFALRLIDEGR